nr:unnamed protein product [Callosobruchus analis]
MEHLPLLMKSMFADTDVAISIQASRTKITKIVNETIAPFVAKKIVSTVNKTFFSIIIDETTDVLTKKCLAILVRYYSHENKKVCDSFFGLVELDTSSAAASIHHVLKNHLIQLGVDLCNLAGFAADNCATMMGQLNGVQSILKEEHPHIVVVGCASHSFHLCSSYACKQLPKIVEELVRDIHSHFVHSSKRLSTLKEFQTFCELKPHKILRPSQTRWLSLQQVVNRIVEQYEPLVLYFTKLVFEDPSPKSIEILNILKNKIIKLYLLFLAYILKIVNKMNLEFQLEQPRLHQLLPRI